MKLSFGKKVYKPGEPQVGVGSQIMPGKVFLAFWGGGDALTIELTAEELRASGCEQIVMAHAAEVALEIEAEKDAVARKASAIIIPGKQ